MTTSLGNAWLTTHIVAGDFDGDGRSDLALLYNTENKVLLLESNLHGAFQTIKTVALPPHGTKPVSLSTGDYNGDGRSDLAITFNWEPKVMFVESDRQNNSDRVQTFALGASADRADGFQTGDFNNDGKTDLAIMDGGSGNVSILMGQSGGTFGAPVDLHVAGSAFQILLGDFNNDGKLDLLVETGFNQLLLHPGNGDGTFAPQVGIPTSVTQPWVSDTVAAVRDVNGDGDPDLLAFDSPNGSSAFSILYSQGHGNYPVVLNRYLPRRRCWSAVMTNPVTPGGPSVRVTEDSGRSTVLSGADLDPGTFANQNISPSSQVNFSGTLARFTPTQFLNASEILTAPSPSGYRATVDWGDGTVTTGTISAGGPAGWFSVTGSHRYAHAGSYSVRVILDPAALQESEIIVLDKATVTNAPIVATGHSLNATEGVPFANTALAQFSDPGRSVSANSPATIDWGDGTTSTGTIRPVLAGAERVHRLRQPHLQRCPASR